MKRDISNYRIKDIRKKLEISDICPLDVMITGVTGAGKSTTLNALFEKTVAKVGDGVDPETMKLDAYRLNDWLRLWDTPGLGDGKDADEEHKQEMIELLRKNAIDGSSSLFGFIDLAIIVIEGSKRDLGTTRTLLEDVILPNIESNRVLVVINQADVAMKGKHWDSTQNCPDFELKHYLDTFAASLQERIRRDTGLMIPCPIYYSAEKGYNIESFMDFIIDNMPLARRNGIDIIKKCGEPSEVTIEEAQYIYNEEDNYIYFSFDKIENNSSWQGTGALQIVCWLSDTRFSFDDGWGSDNNIVIDHRYIDHIPGGGYLGKKEFFFDLRTDLDIDSFRYFEFTINELNEDGKWYIIDHRYVSTDDIRD